MRNILQVRKPGGGKPHSQSEQIHALIRVNKNLADTEFIKQIKGSSSNW